MNNNAIHILKKINAEKLIKKNTIHLMLKEEFNKIDYYLYLLKNDINNNHDKFEKNLSNNLLLENRIDNIEILNYIFII